MNHVKGKSIIKLLLFGLLYSFPVVQQVAVYAQQPTLKNTQNVVQQLVHIEQEQQKLDHQRRDLVAQQNSMQQKMAKEQEQLLYHEQQEQEWRIAQHEALSRADAAIKKLQQENDFAESERLKAKKAEQEKEFRTQQEQKDEEQKKQQEQIAHHRQQIDRLKQEQEKIIADLESKSKEQRNIVDALVAKASRLYASNDIEALRKESAELKTHIERINTSGLKEMRAFTDLLQVPLNTIKQRITYIKTRLFEGFNKQINQIKKLITAAKGAQDFNNIASAIDGLKKSIDVSQLSKSYKSRLHELIETGIEPSLMQKTAAQSPEQVSQITVSRATEQQEESSAPEEIHEQEPERNQAPEPVPIAEKPEAEVEAPARSAPQQKKSSSSSQKKEGRSIRGFVLNKKGDNFDPTEYRNVTVVTDKTGRVVRVAYNNQNVDVLPVPKSLASSRDNTSEWIAAEIYAKQLGNDQKSIAQVLGQAMTHYKQQSNYNHEDTHYNQQLFDYLRLGLIPVLEEKSKK